MDTALKTDPHLYIALLVIVFMWDYTVFSQRQENFFQVVL